MFRFARRLITALVLPAVVSAAGAKSEAIVFVADTRRLSGVAAWFTNLYNESFFYFTLLTVFIIPAMGLILGKFTGFVMALSGIDLKSRVLGEH